MAASSESTSSTASKVKILVFGSIGEDDSTITTTKGAQDHERVTLFLQRLIALHRSKAGPFDAAFVVGSCHPSDVQRLLHKAESSPLPIPVFLHHLTDDAGVVGSDEVKEEEEVHDASRAATSASDSSNRQELPDKLGNNLYVLVKGDEGRSAGIWSLPIPKGGGGGGGSTKISLSEAAGGAHGPRLVVAACPPRIRTDDSVTRMHSTLLKSINHVSYRGCDVLLTLEPPQGGDALLTRPDVVGSFDVADVALRSRPRYHFFPALFYGQSNPFAHVAGTTSTTADSNGASADLVDHPPGRLIAMAPVSTNKDKDAKFVHALGMTPLLSMSTLDLQQAHAQAGNNLLPCPYTDASYATDGANVAGSHRPTTTTSVGLSEASARRILAEERQKRALDGSSRWAQRGGGGGPRANDDPGGEASAVVDPTNTTLFVHGLHKDASGRLQSPEGDAVLLRAFARYGATVVRKPPGAATSSFAFVELQSHEQAVRCLEETGGEVTVGGVHLTLKWASHHGADAGRATKKARTDNHPARMTEAEAKDSTTLYFKIVQAEHNEVTGEAMRSWAEHVLEEALNENASGEEDRVTAKDEPALRVEVRVMDAFGFLDFASHAAASMVVATLTGSVDGGQVKAQGTEGESPPRRPEALQSSVVFVHWARAKAMKTDPVVDNVIEDASGFKFERKHFPADSRLDCWFCLASESCEKHLITGVYDTCYAAMPKGPVHPGHVLLIPIRHSSRGSLQDRNVASEMETLKEKLRDHAASKYDCDLFVFERAIQTRGGYHTHVQCVPVERQLGQRLVTTMMAQAQKTGMNLKEIKSDIGAAALLADSEDEDGDDGGYFYVEVTMPSGVRRFLHKQVPGRHRGGTVPLQFGREVLAAVLGKPDMAHWKSCLLDKEQEVKLATEMRESFTV